MKTPKEVIIFEKISNKVEKKYWDLNREEQHEKIQSILREKYGERSLKHINDVVFHYDMLMFLTTFFDF